MKRQTTLLLLLCVAVSSCGMFRNNPYEHADGPYKGQFDTRNIFGIAAAVIVGGTGYLMKKKQRKEERKLQVTPVIENVDLSGTLHHLGGMLINDHQVIHVTHWPTKIGQPLKFKAIDGTYTHRTLLHKEDIGMDLCVLTLNEPVDLTNHTIIATADPIFHIPTTVFRFEDRPIRGTSVRGYDRIGRVSLNLTPETYLEPGDSGKISVQRQDGSLYVVTLNSTTSGKGPHVHRLLSEWIANDDK